MRFEQDVLDPVIRRIGLGLGLLGNRLLRTARHITAAEIIRLPQPQHVADPLGDERLLGKAEAVLRHFLRLRLGLLGLEARVVPDHARVGIDQRRAALLRRQKRRVQIAGRNARRQILLQAQHDQALDALGRNDRRNAVFQHAVIVFGAQPKVVEVKVLPFKDDAVRSVGHHGIAAVGGAPDRLDREVVAGDLPRERRAEPHRAGQAVGLAADGQLRFFVLRGAVGVEVIRPHARQRVVLEVEPLILRNQSGIDDQILGDFLQF